MAEDASVPSISFAEVIDVDAVDDDRTEDVVTNGSFTSLLISPSTVASLAKAGFKRPSPVQLKAIPKGLIGFDMLVQAKSGTGKTLVFAILAIENLNLQASCVQKLIVAPTREIAIQIAETIKRIGHFLTKIVVLTGGKSVALDREALRRGAHIVIGTTGRVCQLLSEGAFSLSSLSLFVIDEADKMMSETFEKDINYLFSCLPSQKQVCVFSATYPGRMEAALGKFMRSPVHVRLNADDVQLIGVKQYVSVATDEEPVEAAIRVLQSVMFNQALVFCTKSEECQEVCDRLVDAGFPSAAISAKLQQEEREAVMRALRDGDIKILVSTDLTARGVDAEKVNLVVNLEPPFDVETYFHRIGRAARYGGQGAAVSVLCSGRSIGRFCSLVKEGGIKAKRLDPRRPIPPQLTTDRAFHQQCQAFLLNNESTGSDEENKAPEEASPIPLKPTSTIRRSTEQHNDIDAQAEKQEEDGEEKPKDFTQLLQEAMIISRDENRKNALVEEKAEQTKPAKFKFVPSRLKSKTKYYLRGEMISIRESTSTSAWRAYAEKRFDLKQPPFVDAEMPPPEPVKNVKKKEERRQKTGKEEEDKKKEMTKKRVGENGEKREGLPGQKWPECSYTRKDLISICRSRPAKVWNEYTQRRWKTDDEPFVMEPWKRCSYVEQLRRQRDDEKAQRNKVIAERRSQNCRLLSIGHAPSRLLPGISATFSEYCTRVAEEYGIFMREESKVRRGGAIPARSSPGRYLERVQNARKWRLSQQAAFNYSLSKALEVVAEMEVQTEQPDTIGTEMEVQMEQAETTGSAGPSTETKKGKRSSLEELMDDMAIGSPKETKAEEKGDGTNLLDRLATETFGEVQKEEQGEVDEGGGEDDEIEDEEGEEYYHEEEGGYRGNEGGGAYDEEKGGAYEAEEEDYELSSALQRWQDAHVANAHFALAYNAYINCAYHVNE